MKLLLDYSSVFNFFHHFCIIESSLRRTYLYSRSVNVNVSEWTSFVDGAADSGGEIDGGGIFETSLFVSKFDCVRNTYFGEFGRCLLIGSSKFGIWNLNNSSFVTIFFVQKVKTSLIKRFIILFWTTIYL